MEIGKQIKKYRSEMEVSQEELAERIFVSRQTISNWENDKNYPDLKSLVLLSSLFDVSLDILIKGDIEQMKEEIKTEDIKYFKRNSTIFSILFYGMVLSNGIVVILLLGMFLSDFPFIGLCIGIGIWILIFAATMFFALRLEKLKKKYDIQSYKEIVAFYEDKTLSEIDEHREYGKRPYQKLLILIIVGLVAVAVVAVMVFVYYMLMLR